LREAHAYNISKYYLPTSLTAESTKYSNIFHFQFSGWCWPISEDQEGEDCEEGDCQAAKNDEANPEAVPALHALQLPHRQE